MGDADLLAELHGAAGLDERAHSAGTAFSAWRTRRAPDQPLSEQLVLAYLLDHPHWQWTTSKTAAWALERYHRTDGIALVGPLVRAHLSDLRRTARSPLPQTAPLRGADATSISSRLHDLDTAPQRQQGAVLAMRYGLAAVRLAADPNSSLGEAFAGLSTMRLESGLGSTVLVTADGSPVAHMDPHRATLWTQHEQLFADMDRVRRRAAGAATRSGVNLGQRLGDVTDAQWEWLWRMLDASTPRRLRDHAYLLLGFEHARRHAELSRLDITDVVETSTGYAVLYRKTKNGHSFQGDVAHERDGGRCVEHCPSCAVRDLLDWERSCMHRSSGPLLATRYGGTVRRMTRQNGRLRVQALTGLVAEEPWGSTRSLRAGAATTAWEAGWSVEMIAKHVTGHRDVNQADLYIRRHGAPGGTLQLRLTPPAA